MTSRTDEFGSRVPKGFSSTGYTGLNGVADLYGEDKSSRLEHYEGYQYFPKEGDVNLSLNGGSGRDVFLSYSDQALYDDDRIDNYFDILDFNQAKDFLILPFLTSDGVKISQENLYILADIGSGTKDKIFRLSKRAKEHNIGFADQFDSANVRLNGGFKFNIFPNDNANFQKNSIIKPQAYRRRFVDKITNFNSSTDTLEIDTDSFSIDSAATFAAGKNKRVVKKKLARLDVDFLYDQKKGSLYFNENGADKGFGDGGIIAILKGAPELTATHLELV